MPMDDEFERLVAGLGDEISAEPAQPPGLAVVVTPVGSASALAGLCAMSGLSCKVLPTHTGAVAAIALAAVDDPFAALTNAVPAEADELAGALSRLTHLEVVLVVARLSTAEEGPTGQLTAHRYAAGERAGEVSPGLVLSSVDALVEDLLLGAVRLDEVTGVEDTSSIPRWKAARMFTRGLKKRKP